jgi:hypothetical protein
MMLRRIFEHEEVKITEMCGKLHNQRLYSLCLSPDIIRVSRSERA